MGIELASVPTIIAIVYVIVMIYKDTIAGCKENLLKIIPIIAGSLGIFLGILAFYAAPSIMPADNIIMAILVGLISGLSATGINQIYKQMTKDKCKDKNKED